MKNKRLTYFLLPVVASLWGYAIYLYGFSGPDEEMVEETSETLPSPAATAIGADTFSLLANYPDPFGPSAAPVRLPHDRFQQPQLRESAPSLEPSAPASSPKPKVAPTPVEAPPQAPQLRYNGLVQQTGGGSPMGILRIDGKSHFVHRGTAIAGFEVIEFAQDSIVLRQGKSTLHLARK